MNYRTYAEGIYAESNKRKGGSNQEIPNYLGGCYSMGCGKAQARFCWGFTDFIGKGRSPANKQVPSAIGLDGVISKWKDLQELRFELIYLKKDRSRRVR